MAEEIVWDGHDNSIDLILKQKNSSGEMVGISQAGTTGITASFGRRLIESYTTSIATGFIRWNQAGYDTGEIRLFLGQASIAAGLYDVPIITYADAGSSNGTVWGIVKIRVKADIEAT